MVVVTEYGFDAAAWRAAAGHGPECSPSRSAPAATTGRSSRSRRARSSCAPSGPPGITRIVFEGDGESFTLGDVAFEFSSAA